MDKAIKALIEQAEKDIKQYESNIKKGTMQSTDKDPSRMFYLLGTLAMGKLLCMIEKMKEDGEKEGKGGMGGMLHAMGKQMGGGGHGGMQAMMNSILPHGLPQIGFTPSENHHVGNVPYGNSYDTEMRRGVPGSGRGRRAEMDGNYGEMDDDMEMRRGRSSRTGRYVHRAEMGEGMNDAYDDMNMAGGQGGSSSGSGGQSGGSTGGGRR